MARPNESVVFEIQLEAARAQRELADFGKSVEGAGGQLAKTSAMVERLRAKQLDLANALGQAGQATQKDAVLMGALRKELEATTLTLNSFGGSQARVTQGLQGVGAAAVTTIGNTANIAQRLQRTMGPAAGAVQGLSGAMGDGTSTAGKLLAVGGQLGAAFMQGGIIGVGIAAGIFAFSTISKQLAEAEDATRRFKAASEEMANAIEAAGNAKLGGFIDRLEQMRKGLQDFGMSTGDQLVRDLKNQVAADEAALADNERRLEIQRERTLKAEDLAKNTRGRALDERALEERRTLDNLEARVTSLRASVEALRSRIPGAELGAFSERSMAKLNEKPASRGIGDSGGADVFAPREKDVFSMSMIEEDPMEKARRLAIEKRYENEERALVEATNAEWKIHTDYFAAIEQANADHQARMIEETFKANQAVADSYDRLYGDTLQGALGNATASLNQFFVGMAAGEKNAAEKATASFLSSTGNQLVGIGTKAILEGAIISANPLTPGAGLPMMGLGSLAVGAGIGMGATAASITSGLGGAASSKGANDRGVNQGRGGGGSGRVAGEGASFELNVTYGAAGPAPEQTGRAVETAFNSLLSRRGMPRLVQGPGTTR